MDSNRALVCDLHGVVFRLAAERDNIAVDGGGPLLTGLVCPCFMFDDLAGTPGEVCGRLLFIKGPWWTGDGD